ncbi:uncharacterized protein LOC5570921 [Aedes aegypti]|uniref:Uncharacterized protein n=3 Tax=Aedes aegypti TaxID=7159 RepID=A0A1S4EYW9_AEDAE|nr:uncharacterized protein LOC5570921 [Aedes aegypti]
MSGVMFVVHIPSARYEKILRQRVNEELAKANKASVEDEKKKDDKGDGEGTKPFLTPQPPRHLKEQNAEHRSSFLDLADPQQEQHKQPLLTASTENIPFIDVCDTDAVDDQKTPPEKEANGDTNPTANSLAVPFDRSTALRKSWEGFKDIMGSARRTKELQKETEKIQLSADSSLDEVMKEILRQKQIRTSAWVDTNKGRGHQITFSIESGPRCDDVIYMLCSWGIGERYGSTISIASCTLFTEQLQDEEDEKQANNKSSAWNSFLTSARAQLNVASIVDNVRNGAVITFDYVTMLITAAIIAAFGLIEDSSVNLIASMLVSPLMGPILAAVFGTVIKDRNLQMLGIRNETIAIGLVLLSGFFFGLIISSTDEKWGLGEGVTAEMLARCQTHSLKLGIAIALPSGAAVAVAILAENGGGLVGVAISASLLPPSVNAGILWSLSLLSSIYGKAPDRRYATVTQTNLYSDTQSVELFCLGCMSFCLTLVNVCCIYIMGIFILWVKEVAPIIPKDQKQFWNHDIKIARDYNKTMHTMDGMTMNRQLLQELSHFRPHGETDKQGSERWLNTIGRAGQNTWSPRHLHNTREHRPTIQELEALYLSLSANTSDNSSHYPPHHTTHQFMKIPSSYLRSSKPWSPPKFSSAEAEPLSPGGHSNRSKPIEIGFRRHHRFSDSFRASSAPLSKILENVASAAHGGSGEGPSNRQSQKHKNKFIVTPAVDPIHK